MTNSELSRPQTRSGADIGDCDIGAEAKSDLLFAAIAASRVAIVLIDPNRPGDPIVRANPAFEALTGFTEQDALGRDIGMLQQPANDPAIFARIRAAIRAREALDTEAEIRRKDGSNAPAACFLSPVPGADDRVRYVMCALFDIGGGRAAARRRSGAGGLNELGELVRGFGHELNNLLTVMRINLEPLIEVPGDARTPKRLERIAWAVDRAAERVRGFAARFRDESPPGSPDEAPKRTLPRAREGERVLVVEPDAILGLQASSMLSGLGYRVEHVAGPEAALRALSGEERVDLLIAEAKARGEGGELLAERARALANGLKILHCGSAGAGVPGAIAKPFQLLELARAVREAIDAPPSA